MTIRPATEQDIEALCRLFVEFHNFHADGVPGDRLRNLGPPEAFDCAEFTKSVTQILSDSDAVVLVADTGPQLVGMAEVYVKVDAAEPTKPSRKYGYLQSLMVRSDQRRQGIATRLVEQAEQWAREQGVHEMRLETWEFDGGPNLFYEGIGYQTFRRMWVRHL